ncbi:MAG: RNA polymerase sigma factor [Prevotella sp.]
MIKQMVYQRRFEKIYGDNYSRLYYFALSILANEDDCRDIIDDIFLNVWNNIADIDMANVTTYLMSAVHNRAIDLMRRDKLHRHYSDEYIRQATEIYSDYSIEREKDMLVEEMLDRLKPPTDEILRLCYLERKKYAEVAEAMNISQHTVKKHISKALKMLREIYKGKNSTPFR